MSNLIESLAQERHAGRYRTATRASLTAPATTSNSLKMAAPAPQSTRSRAGWLLVGLGLRLIMRGGDTPTHRARLIGQ